MKKNYRITFYDGPEGNRSKNVDVYAESFDDARRQAWQMDEAKYRMYSDIMIEEIPNGPSVIGVEYEYTHPYLKQKFTERVFIKANSEAQALKYFNEHFKERGRATKTYFACCTGYDADATIEAEKEGKIVDVLIADANTRSQETIGDSKEFEQVFE